MPSQLPNIIVPQRQHDLPRLDIIPMGTCSYAQAMTFMDDLHARRVQGQVSDTLLVLEHHPVISKGRRLQGVAIPNQKKILEQGIQIHETDRGGLLTYHGPGQIVFYFIFEVARYFEGVSHMVHGVERLLVDYLDGLGIKSRCRTDHPGIWVGDKKMGSVGFRVADGVTKHGVSLNVACDLSVYGLFDPCGLTGASMSSLKECLQREILPDEVGKIGMDLAAAFQAGFLEQAKIRAKVA